MRLRLALLVAATMTLVLVAFLVPLALLVRGMAADRAVGEATAQAQSLSSVLATLDADSLRLAVEDAAVTVFLPDGTVLGAPSPRTPAVELAARGRSFTVDRSGGREILIAVGLPAGTAVIRTFVDDAALTRGVNRAWLLLAGLGLALLGIGVLVADRMARQLVRPIGQLAQVSHRLGTGDLDARAAPTAGPPEVRAVALALNTLADRIRDLLRHERETAADLSHRIRTPLTALRLDAEALPSPEDARRMLDHVATLDRAVTSAISAARSPASVAGSSDAAAVVRARAAFWAVLAEDQERSFTVAVPDVAVPVAVDADTLGACVDALIGNVFAHTPDGTAFSISLSPLSSGARLVVADDGPGFPTSFDPVRRGASGGASSGLGLDIARRAAAATEGGSFALERRPEGGAAVAVTFGDRALTGP